MLFFKCIVAITGIFLCAGVGVFIRRFLLETARPRIYPDARSLTPAPPAALVQPAKPLYGLRIFVAITQDHPHRTFENLLKEHLLREDVSDVTNLTSSQGAGILADWQKGKYACDILILGEMTCNGYAEVYYQAEFTCYTIAEPICTLIERPPGGDRPENLAIELVARLGKKLDDLVTRNERRKAIGELRDV